MPEKLPQGSCQSPPDVREAAWVLRRDVAIGVSDLIVVLGPSGMCEGAQPGGFQMQFRTSKKEQGRSPRTAALMRSR